MLIRHRPWPVLLLLTGVFWVSVTASAYDYNYEIGDPVPFAMTSAIDESFTHRDLAGKVVMIEFWATWCGPCIRQIPHLKELNQTYSDQGLVMISVSTDRDTRAARRMIKDKQMDWVMVLNEDQPRSISGQFFAGRFGIPHAFLIGRDGNLAWAGHPASIETALREALEQPVPEAEADDEAGESEEASGGEASAAESGSAREGSGASAGVAHQADAAEKAGPADIARTARAALSGETPDFRELLTRAAELSESHYQDEQVQAMGRSIARQLERLDGEYGDIWRQYREHFPEQAAAVDAWLSASGEAEEG